jgi:2-oxoglutarate/2-oxoacid ferredoxin oxidoreductase subunit alpha
LHRNKSLLVFINKFGLLYIKNLTGGQDMTASSAPEKNNFVIVLAGEAGQGVQAIVTLLTKAFKQEGFYVFAAHEFMSRVRGGSNSSLLRIGAQPVCAWTGRNDLCFVFDDKAANHLKNRIYPDTFVLGDGLKGTVEQHFIDVPLARMAKEAGGTILINMIVAGIIWGILGGRKEIIEDVVRSFFSGKTAEIIDNNLTAVRSGIAAGAELKRSGQTPLSLAPPGAQRQDLHLTGTEAFTMGAIAGGCNFVSAYPMSPASGVYTALAKHGRNFGIIVEQAEDEISAANMVIGAWYAGARALTTTSGGGFALMTEALSLAGVTETPMVILLAQRPAPATGLATRTEQGDLNLALYGGHGEFPRILLAPGNPEQVFAHAQNAFYLADTYQVPVIVLTDQYLMDSSCDVANLAVPDTSPATTVVKTAADYQRYAFTETAISPRGVPGLGEGLVAFDSHEHDEDGHISEDLDMRLKMVEKRSRKLQLIAENAMPPDWIGPEDAGNLIICWGSTLEIAREAVAGLDLKNIAIMHFQQVFPLHEETRKRLRKVSSFILLEGNPAGQFGGLLKQYWGIDWKHRILKCNGLQFSVEEVQTALRKIVEQEVKK